MKKTYFLLTMLLMSAASVVSAQTTEQPDQGVLFKGTLVDALEPTETIVGATIRIESATDTISAYSNSNGEFTINGVPRGAVQIRITYPGFTPYSFQMLAEGVQVDLGTIKMSQGVIDLDEVSVIGQIQMMTTRGDTIVYNPEAFQSLAGDYAVDLIVKFPGVEIDDDGVLKAHGEEVKWTLVDGRLMFGRDVSTTLQNVRADDIEEVKIYDIVDPEKPGAESSKDKEDMQRVMDFSTKSKFTGAMNAWLLGGGGSDIGTDDSRTRYKYEGSLGTFSEKNIMMLNFFGNNLKEERTELMRRFMGGGRGSGYGGGSEGYGRRNTLMLTYSNSNPFIGRNKWQVGANYILNNKYDLTDSRSQNYRLDRNEQTNSSSLSRTGTDSHNLTMRISKRWDNANITIQPSVTYTDGYSSSDSFEERLLNDIFQYSLLSDSNRDNNSLSTNGSVNYRLSFPRAGQESSSSGNQGMMGGMMGMFGFGGPEPISDTKAPISLDLNGGWNYSKNNTKGFSEQFSERIGKPDSTNYYLIDIEESSRGFNAGTSVANIYLAPAIRLRANYGINYTYRKSYKMYVDDITNLIDTLQSEIFTQNNYTNNVGTSVDIGKSDWKVNARIDLNYRAIKNLRDESYPGKIDEDRLFHSFTPGFTIGNEQRGSSITKRYQWHVRYNTSTSQPSLEQLRDYEYKLNEFNFAEGNPNLKQSYSHNASASLRIQGSDDASTIDLRASAAYTFNSIVRNTIDMQTEDPANPGNWIYTGTTLTRYLNQDGAKNASFSANINRPLIGNKFILRAGARYGYTETPEYRNDALSWTKAHTPNINAEIRSNHSATIEYGIRNNATWRYSFTTDAANAWTFGESLSANFSVRFFTNFKVEADYSYGYSKTHGERSSSPIKSNLLNATIGWEFAQRNGELKFTVYDILNKESGFSSSISGNSVTNSWRALTGRYCMFTASFRINRTYGGNGGSSSAPMMAPPAGGGPRGGMRPPGGGPGGGGGGRP